MPCESIQSRCSVPSKRRQRLACLRTNLWAGLPLKKKTEVHCFGSMAVTTSTQNPESMFAFRSQHGSRKLKFGLQRHLMKLAGLPVDS